MDENNSLKDLMCGLGNDDHYVEEPITLTNCGHAVCRSCLIRLKTNKIKCICGVTTDRDLRNDKESIPLKRMIKLVLPDLFEDIKIRTEIQLNRLKGNSNK